MTLEEYSFSSSVDGFREDLAAKTVHFEPCDFVVQVLISCACGSGGARTHTKKYLKDDGSNLAPAQREPRIHYPLHQFYCFMKLLFVTLSYFDVIGTNQIAEEFPNFLHNQRGFVVLVNERYERL
jgi:hypothetical protein